MVSMHQTRDGRLIEVSEPACFPLSVQFRGELGRTSYGAVHVMEHHHPLTLGLRQGDSIATWALGRAGYMHKPAGAWTKVVANHRLGFLDWLLTINMARMIMGLIVYPRGHAWPEIVGKWCYELKYLFIEISWCLNSLFNDWFWSAISMAASHLLSTVTPLQLPEDNGDGHLVEVSLSYFIEQLLVAILQSYNMLHLRRTLTSSIAEYSLGRLAFTRLTAMRRIAAANLLEAN
ncbi:hypothetical protein EV702DRAFT_617461 [Suillus placidus]|uniref:Uncharacterized protein n=1 Tax=Suillus placidus TaxID=48579 RepID=A0A9P6ZPG4_9AGAM|nr:hypothetical protein EV702DRAFT_617461 [Suillus placidus]